MISLRKLNCEEIWLNPLLVELVSAHPDCVITLSNGHKYMVRESAEEVAERMRLYFQGLSLRIASDCSALPGHDEQDDEGQRSDHD